jgi:RNA polymerase sigma-70 factor (ECF subfamily)
MADDEAAMRRFQRGAEAAYEEIVRRWESPMLSFFFRSVGDTDTAEDLRQELFVRLYTRRDSYRGDGSFRSWLFSIAVNLLRSHFRSRRNVVSIEEIEAGDGARCGESAPAAMVASADGTTAVIVAQRKEAARVVRQLLAELPDEDRAALLLRFFERLQYREIAEALGAPEPTVKSRVYRALERLRQMAAKKGLTAGDLL